MSFVFPSAHHFGAVALVGCDLSHHSAHPCNSRVINHTLRFHFFHRNSMPRIPANPSLSHHHKFFSRPAHHVLLINTHPLTRAIPHRPDRGYALIDALFNRHFHARPCLGRRRLG